MIYRLKFEKYGPVRFVGHLDLMRYFQKVMRRGEIDIKFSEGYSPHMLMRFAQPLPVGATGEGEYMDITMRGESTQSPEDVLRRMNGVMREGIRILDACALEEGAVNAMSAVSASAWDIGCVLKEVKEMPREELSARLDGFLSKDRIITLKKTKKGEKEFDIRPLILEARVTESGSLYLLLCAGNENNVKPTLFTETFFGFMGIPPAEDALKATARLSIHHLETYMTRETADGELLVPLIERKAE